MFIDNQHSLRVVSGQYEDSTNDADVILIAEKDGIRAYRAINNGSIIYFTNKGGVALFIKTNSQVAEDGRTTVH